MERLGRFIAEKRVAAGLRGDELAYRIGRAPSWVSRMETGGQRTLPDPDVMRALANELRVTMPDLLEAAGYLQPGERPQALVNPFHRDDIRFRVVEAMKALDMDGPDGPFLTMFFRLKLRDLIDIGQYGVGEDGLSELVLDHETTQAG